MALPALDYRAQMLPQMESLKRVQNDLDLPFWERFK
jgi:hypothetical protein